MAGVDRRKELKDTFVLIISENFCKFLVLCVEERFDDEGTGVHRPFEISNVLNECDNVFVRGVWFDHEIVDSPVIVHEHSFSHRFIFRVHKFFDKRVFAVAGIDSVPAFCRTRRLSANCDRFLKIRRAAERRAVGIEIIAENEIHIKIDEACQGVETCFIAQKGLILNVSKFPRIVENPKHRRILFGFVYRARASENERCVVHSWGRRHCNGDRDRDLNFFISNIFGGPSV